MQKPKLSIITAVYDKEKYIHKCIKSILNQTYRNFEYILVDDESPDNCPQICDDYQEKDSRVKVIHRKNGGHAEAYNSGISVVDGDYILIVDADDYLSYDAALMDMVQLLMIENPDILVTDFLNVWSETPPKKNNCRGIQMLRYFISENIYHPTTRAKLIKKEIFDKVGGFKKLISDDEEWTPRAFYYANKISILPKSIYTRTTPENSVTMIQSEDNYYRKAFDKAATTKYLIDFFESKNISSNVKEDIYKRFIALYFSSIDIYCNRINRSTLKHSLYEQLIMCRPVLNYCNRYNDLNHNAIYWINRLLGFRVTVLTFNLISKFRKLF
jgi:glycosyltransferase involved in cell wall biosynthesis